MALKIQPTNNFILLNNIPLQNDYENQMDFANKNEQYLYFISKAFQNYEQFNYIRNDSIVRVPINYEACYNCNYVMYQNSNFGAKWIYAFITRKEYINPNTTALYIETDVFQTWQFDIEYLKSFISREHRPQYAGNMPVWNLFPEGVEFGRDYVVTHTENITWNDNLILISSSADLTKAAGSKSNPNLVSAPGGIFDRTPSATSYYIVDNLGSGGSTSPISTVLSGISNYPWVGQCIQSLTIVPREVIGTGGYTVQQSQMGFTIGVLNNGYVSQNSTIKTVPNFLQYFDTNYKNSKLYSYPYSFIEMTCYNGQQFIIKPECVNQEVLNIGLMNYIGASPRLAYYVEGYNSFGDNGISGVSESSGEFLDASVILGSFPQFPIMIDNYLLYMAQNANSFALSNSLAKYNIVESGVKGAAQVLTGGGIWGGLNTAYTGIKGGIVDIKKQLAKQQDAEINPPSMAGQTGGEAFNIGNNINGAVLKWKTIRSNYQLILEDFFTRYGYVSNRMGNITYTGNQNFNYVETTECLINGNIPDEDIQVLKNMFNKGVTIWHNGKVGSYTDNPRI